MGFLHFFIILTLPISPARRVLRPMENTDHRESKENNQGPKMISCVRKAVSVFLFLGIPRKRGFSPYILTLQTRSIFVIGPCLLQGFQDSWPLPTNVSSTSYSSESQQLKMSLITAKCVLLWQIHVTGYYLIPKRTHQFT